MGCCPSKQLASTGAVEATAAPPSVASEDPVGLEAVGGPPTELLMDRGDGTLMDKSDDEDLAEDTPELDEQARDDGVSPGDLEVHLCDADEPIMVFRAPRKESRNADDIPISSTYHRVHSVEVAELEAKRSEELRVEAEQHEREMREYKAAVQLVA
ncbi:hypothetical protein BBJ28_00005704 [Nothophytophthora sp. Chile5]|nr:hypothetical protein BBJ28_00005704 [Nothophytophthora sp. Chile5]